MVAPDQISILRDRVCLADSLLRIHRLAWADVHSRIPNAAKAIDDLDYFPPTFVDDLWGCLHSFLTGKGIEDDLIDELRHAPAKLSILADRMVGCDKSYFLRWVKLVNAVVQHIDRFGSADPGRTPQALSQ